MVTFNVIWYWKNTFKYIRTGSDLTRGRDIMKEPDFLTRINPTFGVSLDGKLTENFFIGGTFEFARGGSIIAGWHYGKVRQMADSDFVLGEDLFTGTEDEIRLTDKWKWGYFFGITLDTRIFNKVFSRQ